MTKRGKSRGVWTVGTVAVSAILWAAIGSSAWAHPDLSDPELNAAKVAVMKSFPGAIITNWQPAPMPGRLSGT